MVSWSAILPFLKVAGKSAGSWLSKHSGSLLSSGGSILGLFGSNSAKKSFEYSKALQQHQYELERQSRQTAFQDTRYSLEQAGYNPLLATGQQASSLPVGNTMSVQDDRTENLNNAISAISALSSVKLNNSQTKANSAGASLALEQAKTEQAKRVQMDFQNAMLDVEKHLKQKDLDTYDRRFYANIYEQMQRAENYKAQSAIGMMNAQTNARNAQTAYMNYIVNSRNADTNRYNAVTNRYKRTNSYGLSLKGGSYSTSGFDFGRYEDDIGRLYGFVSNY